ncbi:hypothetical protein PCASD_24382 [Puccinia coronata f. sp. avenae]|uniref:Uncharacterized protein n=1 Tax=Puccinia coronata f. sp. avenae TaxID=200324 RepID=A0A2N5TQG9_9BASI|nr:hypothetical protein PCASD_24382 [Puccinia coronata f. sp. avenae]
MSPDDANIQMHTKEFSELGMRELGVPLGSAPRQVANRLPESAPRQVAICLPESAPRQVASYLRPAGESSLTGSKLPTCLLGYFSAGRYLPAKDSSASSYLPAEDSLAGSYLPAKDSLAGSYIPAKEFPSRQAATCEGLLSRQVAACLKDSLEGR